MVNDSIELHTELKEMTVASFWSALMIWLMLSPFSPPCTEAWSSFQNACPFVGTFMVCSSKGNQIEKVHHEWWHCDGTALWSSGKEPRVRVVSWAQSWFFPQVMYLYEEFRDGRLHCSCEVYRKGQVSSFGGRALSLRHSPLGRWKFLSYVDKRGLLMTGGICGREVCI
jgi:hypothetical protein